MRSLFRNFQQWLADRHDIFIYRRAIPFGTKLRIDLKQHHGLRTPRVLFDVGANHGQTALEFARWYPNSKIHSFEPMKNTCDILRKSVAHIPNVSVHQIAFGAKAGTVTVTPNDCDDMTSLVGELQPASSGSKPTETITVDTVDNFVARAGIDHIDVLKIDTEGFDQEVLRGAEQTLRRGAVDFILVEFGEIRNKPRHVPIGEHEQFLQPLGFRLNGIYDQAPYYYANALFKRH